MDTESLYTCLWAAIIAIYILLIASKKKSAVLIGFVLILCCNIQPLIFNMMFLNESIGSMMISILPGLVMNSLLGCTGLCINHFTNGLSHRKNLLYLLILVCIIYHSLTIIRFFPQFLNLKYIVDILFSTMPIFIALYIVWYVFYNKQPYIHLGKRANTSCWICTMITSLCVILAFIFGAESRIFYPIIILIGYILLIRGKKWGYLLICSPALCILSMERGSLFAMYRWADTWLVNLLCFANPIITGIMIAHDWKDAIQKQEPKVQPTSEA